MKREADAGVLAWLDAQSADDLHTTTITLTEIRYGIGILPTGRRRDTIAIAAEQLFEQDFDGRILPFDIRAAVQCAEVRAERRAAGREIKLADAMIAGIARAHGASVITRNVGDFEDCKVPVVNPWNHGTRQ